MKPFDLEAALRGEPVVTRDGRPVTQLVKFDVDGGASLVGVLGGLISVWYESGKLFRSEGISQLDLFMAPKKRTVWVNLYPHKAACYYDTEAKADNRANDGLLGNRITDKAYPIEIEE